MNTMIKMAVLSVVLMLAACSKEVKTDTVASTPEASQASVPVQASEAAASEPILPISTKFGDQTPEGFVFDQDDVIQMNKHRNNQDMGFMAVRFCERNNAPECGAIYEACYEKADRSPYCIGYIMKLTVTAPNTEEKEGVDIAEKCLAGKSAYAEKCRNAVRMCEGKQYGSRDSVCNGFLAKIWSEGISYEEVKAKIAAIPTPVAQTQPTQSEPVYINTMDVINNPTRIEAQGIEKAKRCVQSNFSSNQCKEMVRTCAADMERHTKEICIGFEVGVDYNLAVSGSSFSDIVEWLRQSGR